MAPPEKGPRGSPGVAGHADLQPVFHWISRGVEISKLLPYLIHPSWFLNTPFSAHHQLYFSVTSSISFSISLSSPSPPSSVTSSSPFPLQSSFPCAHCSCNSSRLCPQLSDFFPCALGPGICPYPRLSHRLRRRLQTCGSSPGLSLGPQCPHTTECTCSVGVPGALTHSLPKSLPTC